MIKFRSAAITAVAAACAMSIGMQTADAAKPPVAGYKQIHVFPGGDTPEGFGPYGELALGTDGNFYGVDFYGGSEDKRCDCSIGGTAYRMAPTGKVTVLHTFDAPTSGTGSSGGLTLGTDGAFYGLATGGGKYGGGTAYKIDQAGNFTLLYSFGKGPSDGLQPYLGRLVQGPNGNFYGLTMRGGANKRGALFMMTPAGEVSVLHAFAGGPADGATPRGGLMLASDGNLYGTTLCGGDSEAPGQCGGTVFSWSFTTGFSLVHSFSGDPAGKKGYAPQATLTEFGKFLYGTTTLGGTAGAGTVYKIFLKGSTFSVVHSFLGGVAADAPNDDGKAPVGRLVAADDGRLYGTTANGGSNRLVDPDGDGTIFSIAADDTYNVEYAFGAVANDGSHPMSGFAKDSKGVLYGVTETGDGKYTGTAYTFTPAAN